MAEDETPNASSGKTSKKSAARAAPKAAAPAQAADAPEPPTSSTRAATDAVSSTYNTVRDRLQVGEQMALSGAGLIAAVWIIFDLLLDVGSKFFPVVSNVTLLFAVLMLLAIWTHRWGHYDFGNGYRLVIGVVGLSLLLFAVTDLLLTFRTDLDASASQWLGNLLYWVGGVVTGYGAWLVFRLREE